MGIFRFNPRIEVWKQNKGNGNQSNRQAIYGVVFLIWPISGKSLNVLPDL